MKRPFITILTISLLFAICSCKKAEISTIFDGNIKIKMNETVDSVKRTLHLNCYTEKIFECANYGIETTYTLTNDKITINFIKIIPPGVCLTSPKPASTIIDLNGLVNKTYSLELNFGEKKITGQLDVATGSFIATMPAQTKVQFINPDLKRVPDNSVYGTIHYHTVSTNPIVQKFIDSLQFYGANAVLYPQGDYGQFQIEANQQIKQTQDPGYYFTRYYIFNYTANTGQLKDLVKRFGATNPNQLLVTLYTTKGETFYSWVQ